MNEVEKINKKSPAQTATAAGTVTIIGTGLIGGSFGLVLKDKGLAEDVIAVDLAAENQQRALELGIADEVLPLKEAIAKSDLIVLAIPVDALHLLLPEVLDEVDEQVVMDMGSTKQSVIDAVTNHPKRKRFVATHPM